jgi:hypothetical protein
MGRRVRFRKGPLTYIHHPDEAIMTDCQGKVLVITGLEYFFGKRQSPLLNPRDLLYFF